MQHNLEPRRACITGCGALSPIGNRASAFWEALLAGRTGLDAIRSFDTHGITIARAGEVKGFEPGLRLSDAEQRRLERIHQFGLFAVREAVEDAQLDVPTMERSRVGVVVATSLGGMLVGEEYQRSLACQDSVDLRESPSRRRQRRAAPQGERQSVSHTDSNDSQTVRAEALEARSLHVATGQGGFDVRRLLDFPYYATATGLAREIGVRGPVVSPSIACASGTHVVGLALELIRAGQADVCVVGGVETLCAFVVNGFNCLRATTADTVRPFDARRSGLLLGEGAAMLVVEERDHARARGARTDVEVVGTGLAGDATHMTAPARDGAGAARAMRMALTDAGIAPTDVDFISAHGTGTIYNDAMEMAAITSVFGEAAARIPVNSIKGSIGHTLGAAGSFEAIMCAQVLRTGLIPATVNCEQLDPACHLDIVIGAPRRQPVRTVLSTSSAFAGNNAAIVLQRADSSMTDPGRYHGHRRDLTARSIGRARWRHASVRARRAVGPLSGMGVDGARGAAVVEIPLDIIPADKRTHTGRLDRLCRLFLSAAYLAVDAAALRIDEEDAERMGLSFGTGLGCLLTNAEYNQKLVAHGPAAASPRLFAYTVSSAAAGEVSIALGIKGPNVTAHAGLAAGLQAIGYGFDLIRTGKADVVLAGGADALGEALVRGLATCVS